VIALLAAPLALVLDTGGVNGLSGWTTVAENRAVAVAERARSVLPIVLESGAARAETPWKLEGVEAVEETEDIAALPEPDHFVLVTERQEAGATGESLLFARRDGDTLRVESRIAVPFAPWGLTAEANAGLEGVCVVGDTVLAALETPLSLKRGRAAAIAAVNRRTGVVTPLRVRLTSETGKLSALACRPVELGIDVVAIERHYGVGRLIGFTVPKRRAGAPLPSRVLVDFSKQIEPLPNFEGLIRLGPDRVALLTDNDSGQGIGETRILILDVPSF
jgi:hypothetical protein